MAPRKPENERKVTSFRPFGNIASHVDPMVLWTFLGLFIISAALLAFQLDNREDCSTTEIKLVHAQSSKNSKTYAVGDVITFNADKGNKKNTDYTWDFGDSTAKATGRQVYHSFNKAGSYMVTLSCGKCNWTREVMVIMNVSAAPDTKPELFPLIEGPDAVFAGRPATFTNNSSGASKWTWKLMQDNAEVHFGQSVTYTFSSPGERTLSLIVNGDTAHMVMKRINVFPARPIERNNAPDIPFAPPPPVDSVKKEAPVVKETPRPSISDDEFKYLLTQVTAKQKNAPDFAQYLCNNLQARVVLNGKDVDNFSHFCSRIYGKKKFQIERVNLAKDEKGCVKEILIVYDKKRFLGIF
jgi:hypothetical protein